MSTSTVEGFSISHAAIIDGVTGAELVNGGMYGVREGSVAVDVGNYDNTGDDVVLSSWFWFNYATVTVKSGYLPMPLISILTGATLTSSGAAPNDVFSIPLWNVASLNQPRKPMYLRIPSKDNTGAVRRLDICLYAVQFEPIQFEGPVYKQGLTLDYVGRALVSGTDEVGGALADKAIGRLVSSSTSYAAI